MLRRVIVNTIDPTISFQAVLWRCRGSWLTLRDVELLIDGKPPMKMDGETILERNRVAFLQVSPWR